MWRGKFAAGRAPAGLRAMRVLAGYESSFSVRALRPVRLRFGVASHLAASRTSRIPGRAATSRQTPSSTPPFGFRVALRPAFVDRLTTVDGWLAAVFAYAAPVGRSIHAAPGPLKCRPSHTAQFPVRRCGPLRASARARPSRIVCPWLVFRPSRAVWLRFLSVFGRSSRGPSRPAAGAGREGEQAASSWAGRRTDRQRLAQRRSGPEGSARQVCSAVAGAAPTAPRPRAVAPPSLATASRRNGTIRPATVPLSPQSISQGCPARILQKFSAYPLGILPERPYDGGLSFSARNIAGSGV